MTQTSSPSVLLVKRDFAKCEPAKWIASIGINLTAGVVTALAIQIAGVEVASPLPATSDGDTYWGIEVRDPYRFLENTGDPIVAGWMRDQANATSNILSNIPGRAALLARLTDVENSASGTASQIRPTAGDRWFYLKRDPQDNQFRLVWRQGQTGAEKVIFDPQPLSISFGSPHAIMDFAPSPDGRKIAYSVQVGGSEIGTLNVVDVETGATLIEPVDAIRYASVSWLDDSTGFFYSRLRSNYKERPATERFGDRARHFHRVDELKARNDRVVFSPSRAPELNLPDYASGYISQIRGTRIAAMVVAFGVDRRNALFLADLDDVVQGNARWRQVLSQADQVVEIEFGGGWIYVRTDANAPRFKVMRIPLSNPSLAQGEEVLPASSSVIVSLSTAKDGLYISKRDGVLGSVLRVPHSPPSFPIEIQPIELPVKGTVSVSADSAIEGAIFNLGSWTRTTKPYQFNPSNGQVVPLPLAKSGTFDAPPGITSREVLVPSHDGTLVPVSIISRTDLKLNGNNPTILYGYGAYGTTESPFLSPSVYTWIERGGIYAFAHVRGGGLLGSDWHAAGKITTKPNTWKDAIAAAEWLVQNQYTSPTRLGIYGGSAGGILVGRAITERPDLFAAAIPSVGVMDSVRMELEPNGAANIPEFGTTKREDQFKALLAMSSYHAIQDGHRYPATLLVHGVNDIRVRVSNSTKFASRLVQAQANLDSKPAPVLLRLEYQAGPGQGSTREQSRERTIDIFSFLLWQFGEPGFLPINRP
jgi:prolyl oligopeptidase